MNANQTVVQRHRCGGRKIWLIRTFLMKEVMSTGRGMTGIIAEERSPEGVAEEDKSW
jgi:hypothetical protein